MVNISVIIPIYNTEKYIAQCLDSVLNQTYTSYEILCVDDASTDNSMEIVEQYAKSNGIINVFRHVLNCGLSAARNTGIKNANGKYILFLDADDMILPETLEELFDCAEKKNLDIVYFNYKKIYESEVGHVQDARHIVYSNYTEVYSGKKMFCLFVQEKKLKIEAWRQFYRKDFLIENNIYFYEGILHEDNLFSFLCAMKSKRVMNINKIYYLYRQHRGSIMTTINEKRAQSMYVVCLEIFKYWNRHEFSEELNSAIKYYFEIIYLNYLYYKDCCNICSDLQVGSYAEKYVYSLYSNPPKRYATLSKEKINLLRKAKYIIVFGAGMAAHDIVQIMQKENIIINAIAVSDVKTTAKTLCGIKVRRIQELIKYNKIATVVIGVTKKYYKVVEEDLKKVGFEELVEVDEGNIKSDF